MNISSYFASFSYDATKLRTGFPLVSSEYAYLKQVEVVDPLFQSRDIPCALSVLTEKTITASSTRPLFCSSSHAPYHHPCHTHAC